MYVEVMNLLQSCYFQSTTYINYYYYAQVEETATLLGNLSVRVKGMGNLTINEMKQHPTFTLLLMSLSADTPLHSASSVMGFKNRELVNVGSSVEFCTGPGEVNVCMDQ